MPPTTGTPAVAIIGPLGTTLTIKLSPHSGTRKKRPAGVTSAAVFVFVGGEAPADLKRWRMVHQTNGVIVDLPFDPTLRPGTKVWVTARSRSPTVRGGPAAQGVCTRIAGGELAIAA